MFLDLFSEETQTRGSTVYRKLSHPGATLCRSGWQRGLGSLNPNPHSSAVSVGSSPLSSLFTWAISVQIRPIPVHTTLECGTEPFRAQLRSVKENTILMREQKPYPV